MNYKEIPEISDKQKEIVNLVFKFRFINRHQFQKLFNHKDPSRLNKWLKDLVDKKYLGRIYSHKLLENTKPAIYYLDKSGIVWARYEKGEEFHADAEQLEFKYLKKFYQDKNASESFINHCTSMFDIYLQVKKSEDKNKTEKNDLEYWFETKTEIWIERQLRLRGNISFDDFKELIPDAYIAKSEIVKDKSEDGEWFIILFDSHVPRYAMRYKVDKFIESFDENEGKKIPGLVYDFPVLLFIFPTQQKANQIGKYIKKSLDKNYVEGMEIYTSTIQKVLDIGILEGNKTWTEIETEDDEDEDEADEDDEEE